MPLIRPEVKRVLQEAGIEKEPTGGTISDKFAQAGLSDDDIAQELADLARHSTNEPLKLRALETVAKIRGALKETPPSVPTFNIIIQSASPSSEVPSVNPILFPRQSLGTATTKNTNTDESAN